MYVHTTIGTYKSRFYIEILYIDRNQSRKKGWGVGGGGGGGGGDNF